MPRTAWHITFGTYGNRLHGDARQTVDRRHNKYGTPFVEEDPTRERRARGMLSAHPVILTIEQRQFIERTMPSLCERGSWTYVTCAAVDDHVHVLLDADEATHGRQVRAWLKRWLTQSLSARWTMPQRSDGSSWFCEGGSNKAVKSDRYFANVVEYINKQRITLPELPDGSHMRIATVGEPAHVAPISAFPHSGAIRPGSPPLSP